MTNKANAERQRIVELVLVVLSLLIAVIAYFFVVSPTEKKVENLKQQNKLLQAQAAVLEMKLTNKTKYENDIMTYLSSNKEILGKYASCYSTEKDLVLLQELEEKTGISFQSASFSDAAPIFKVEGEDYQCLLHRVSVTYKVSYEGLKKFMDYVNAYPERMNVDSFSSNFDQENGQLTGSMVLNLFIIEGDGRTDNFGPIKGVQTGNDNIFGTIEAN